MAFRMNDGLKNYLCDTGVVTIMAGTTGTGGTASLRLYTGSQPASATEGSTGTLSGTWGTLLVEITGIGWSAATSGTSTFATAGGYTGTAVTTGTVGWGRMETIGASGTYRIDGDVGTSGNEVYNINVIAMEVDDVITLDSANIYMA